jgi:glycosyltransferase involved in cell wall biosynthesis
MRIAFVYDAVYPFKIGGVEKRIWEISRRLSARGHEVHIFSMNLWDGPADIFREGVYLHGVCRRMRFHSVEGGSRAIFPALWFSIALLIPLLRRGRFEVIDCQNFPYFSCFTAWIASVAGRSRLMITWAEVWGPYWQEYLGLGGKFGEIIEKLVSVLPGQVIAISATTRSQLQNLGVEKDIAIVPCGVDLEKVRIVSSSAEKSDVIFVGRLIRDKHADILIGALGLLKDSFPDLRCTIVGRGPEEESIRDQVSASRLEDNVRFIGFTRDYDDILSLMKSSRMCVLPATREGFGMVALEALACGIPVITADHPRNAIKDLVGIGNVRIIPLSVEAFAEAMREGIVNPGSVDPSRLEEKWDWEAVTRQWLREIPRFPSQDSV